MIMPKDLISKKKSRESKTVKEESDLASEHDFVSSMHLMRVLSEQAHLEYRSVRFSELADILAQKKSEKRYGELLQALIHALPTPVNFFRIGLPAVVERRLEELESLTSIHNTLLERLHARIVVTEVEEQEEAQPWPAFASQEFETILSNMKGLEDAGEDKSLMLYHIMEIETLLGKIERKARATNREYEARLTASLRDICRVHEPSELSDEQVKCFTGSLQALIEGWGALNREKVKWIRGRLLEVGLTWLPVTEKAQKVIDEAKSSVK